MEVKGLVKYNRVETTRGNLRDESGAVYIHPPATYLNIRPQPLLAAPAPPTFIILIIKTIFLRQKPTINLV